jgi:hypothetical protein
VRKVIRRRRPSFAISEAGSRCRGLIRGATSSMLCSWRMKRNRREPRGSELYLGGDLLANFAVAGLEPGSSQRFDLVILAPCRGANLYQEVRFAEDSPLEGAGFEPSVPRKAPGVVG